MGNQWIKPEATLEFHSKPQIQFLSHTDFHSYSSPQGFYFHSSSEVDQEDVVKAHQGTMHSKGSLQVITLYIPVLSPREHLDEGQLAADKGGVNQPEVKTLKSQSALWNIYLPQACPQKQQDGLLPWGTVLLLSCQRAEAVMVTAAGKTKPGSCLGLSLKLCLALCNVDLTAVFFCFCYLLVTA